MGYYITVKRNKLLIYTIQINPQRTVVSNKVNPQRLHTHDSIYVIFLKWQNYSEYGEQNLLWRID